MFSRFTRYPGGKILGFGATTQMQKRNYYFSEGQMIACLGIYAVGACSPFLAVYLAYKSYRYFHNNYEIVRKNKKNDENTNSNEKNVSEEHSSIRRPGMGSNGK